MIDYDWRKFKDRTFNRFPDDVNGFAEWRQFVENFPSMEFSFTGKPEQIKCPRVFISHKKEDEKFGRCAAWLAVQENFEFWLDVLDPPLQAFLSQRGRHQFSPLEEARLTAAIIEMGLINCTHIIAIITNKAQPSRWIPYEYGRVKDTATLVGPTASWVSLSEINSLPEYLHLGYVDSKKKKIREWLKEERKKLNQAKPALQSCKGGNWTTDEPLADLVEIL